MRTPLTFVVFLAIYASCLAQSNIIIKDEDVEKIKQISRPLLSKFETSKVSEEKKFIAKSWKPIIDCFSNGCGVEEKRKKSLLDAYNFILPDQDELKYLKNKLGINTEPIAKRNSAMKKGAASRWPIIENILRFYYRISLDEQSIAIDKFKLAYDDYNNLVGQTGKNIKKNIKEYYGIDEGYIKNMGLLILKKKECNEKEIKRLERDFLKFLVEEYYRNNSYEPNLINTITALENCECASEEVCKIADHIAVLMTFFRAKKAYDKGDCAKAILEYENVDKKVKSSSSNYLDQKMKIIGFPMDDISEFALALGHAPCNYTPAKAVISEQNKANNDIQNIRKELNANIDSCNFTLNIDRYGIYGENLAFHMKITDCRELKSKTFIMPTGIFVTKGSEELNMKVTHFLKTIKSKTNSEDYVIVVRGLADSEGNNSGYGDYDISVSYSHPKFTLPTIENFYYTKLDSSNIKIGTGSLDVRNGQKLTSNYELAAVRAYQLINPVLDIFPDRSKLIVEAAVGGLDNGKRENPKSRGVEILVTYEKALISSLNISPENEDFHRLYFKYLTNAK